MSTQRAIVITRSAALFLSLTITLPSPTGVYAEPSRSTLRGEQIKNSPRKTAGLEERLITEKTPAAAGLEEPGRESQMNILPNRRRFLSGIVGTGLGIFAGVLAGEVGNYVLDRPGAGGNPGLVDMKAWQRWASQQKTPPGFPENPVLARLSRILNSAPSMPKESMNAHLDNNRVQVAGGRLIQSRPAPNDLPNIVFSARSKPPQNLDPSNPLDTVIQAFQDEAVDARRTGRLNDHNGLRLVLEPVGGSSHLVVKIPVLLGNSQLIDTQYVNQIPLLIESSMPKGQRMKLVRARLITDRPIDRDDIGFQELNNWDNGRWVFWLESVADVRRTYGVVRAVEIDMLLEQPHQPVTLELSAWAYESELYQRAKEEWRRTQLVRWYSRVMGSLLGGAVGGFLGWRWSRPVSSQDFRTSGLEERDTFHLRDLVRAAGEFASVQEQPVAILFDSELVPGSGLEEKEDILRDIEGSAKAAMRWRASVPLHWQVYSNLSSSRSLARGYQVIHVGLEEGKKGTLSSQGLLLAGLQAYRAAVIQKATSTRPFIFLINPVTYVGLEQIDYPTFATGLEELRAA